MATFLTGCLNAAALPLLSLFVCFAVRSCRGCSPPEGWKPPTVVDKVHQANRIVYGRVLNKYPDTRFTSTAYTVEVEVFCVLKGDTTPLRVNITGAGYIDGHCISTKFSVGEDHVILTDGELSVENQIKPTEKNLNEIKKACGLNPVTRPGGSESSIDCPVSADDCIIEPAESREEERGDEEEEFHYDAYEDARGKAAQIKNSAIGQSAGPLSVMMTITSAATAALALLLH